MAIWLFHGDWQIREKGNYLPLPLYEIDTYAFKEISKDWYVLKDTSPKEPVPYWSGMLSEKVPKKYRAMLLLLL